MGSTFRRHCSRDGYFELTPLPQQRPQQWPHPSHEGFPDPSAQRTMQGQLTAAVEPAHIAGPSVGLDFESDAAVELSGDTLVDGYRRGRVDQIHLLAAGTSIKPELYSTWARQRFDFAFIASVRFVRERTPSISF
jgi:hypothetical protein